MIKEKKIACTFDEETHIFDITIMLPGEIKKPCINHSDANEGYFAEFINTVEHTIGKFNETWRTLFNMEDYTFKNMVGYYINKYIKNKMNVQIEWKTSDSLPQLSYNNETIQLNFGDESDKRKGTFTVQYSSSGSDESVLLSWFRKCMRYVITSLFNDVPLSATITITFNIQNIQPNNITIQVDKMNGKYVFEGKPGGTYASIRTCIAEHRSSTDFFKFKDYIEIRSSKGIILTDDDVFDLTDTRLSATPTLLHPSIFKNVSSGLINNITCECTKEAEFTAVDAVKRCAARSLKEKAINVIDTFLTAPNTNSNSLMKVEETIINYLKQIAQQKLKKITSVVPDNRDGRYVFNITITFPKGTSVVLPHSIYPYMQTFKENHNIDNLTFKIWDLNPEYFEIKLPDETIYLNIVNLSNSITFQVRYNSSSSFDTTQLRLLNWFRICVLFVICELSVRLMDEHKRHEMGSAIHDHPLYPLFGGTKRRPRTKKLNRNNKSPYTRK